MAIQFLDGIDFNGTEITSVLLQNSAGTPASNLGGGQIVYDSNAGTIKFYDGVAATWVELDGQGTGGTVTSVNGGTSTFVTNTVTGSTGAAVLTSTLSATGTASSSTYLRGDNSWATIPASMSFTISDGSNSFTVTQGDTLSLDSTTSTISISAATADVVDFSLTSSGVTAGSYTSANITVDTYGRVTAASAGGAGTMTSWTIGSTSGSNQTVSNGEIVDVVGGTAISGTIGGTRTVTLSHDAFGTASTYAYPSSVTTNSTGHITSITAGVAPGTMSSWTFGGDSGADQTVTDGNNVSFLGRVGIDTVSSATDDLTINLDLNELAVTTTWTPITDYLIVDDGGNNRKILSDNISISNWGTAVSTVNMGTNKILNVKTGTAQTDGVNLGQVQALVAGVGVFQGGYNATTNVPALTGASNVALTTGDFYVVTTDGSFFTETLEVGDLIFANTTIPASSTPSLSDYTVVIQDQNIAGAGATDGATEKGVAGFDSANFNVSANGWVQLDTTGVTAGSYGSASTVGTFTVDTEGLLTAASNATINIPASAVQNFCAEVESCVETTYQFAGDIPAGTSPQVTHNLDTRDVQVTVYQNSTPYDTVFAKVARTSVDVVTFTFATAVTAGQYRAVITASK